MTKAKSKKKEEVKKEILPEEDKVLQPEEAKERYEETEGSIAQAKDVPANSVEIDPETEEVDLPPTEEEIEDIPEEVPVQQVFRVRR